jgi:glycosyltransferase involved in cell wall biosynthesis
MSGKEWQHLKNKTVQDKKIVVVIPTYNEGPVVISIVKELLLRQYIPVIVEDGSLSSMKAELKNYSVFFLRHRVNLGQGAALQTGFEFAKHLDPDYVITMDADGQHDAAGIPRLLQPLERNEADTVLGSRFLEAGSNSIPFGRKLVLHSARVINYFF